MNTDITGSNLRKQQAIEKIRDELHQLYWEQIGQEPNPDILWAEAEDFVAKFGPEASLRDLF
jgi:hypothetical protein